MAYIKRIVCLAHSYKIGGRCIAGYEAAPQKRANYSAPGTPVAADLKNSYSLIARVILPSRAASSGSSERFLGSICAPAPSDRSAMKCFGDGTVKNDSEATPKSWSRSNNQRLHLGCAVHRR
jgi:hypothetical protein